MTTNNLRQKVLDDMCSLGEMYLRDGHVDEALHWLELASSLGSGNADYKLGDMYYYGDGVPEDLAKAAEYFLKSGFYGDDLIVGFGDMFRYGRGVDKDINKAIFFYEAEANYAYNEECRNATLALGEIYRDGEGGIKPDGEKSVRYFTEATTIIFSALIPPMAATKRNLRRGVCIFTGRPSRKTFTKPRGGSPKRKTFTLST